MVQFESLSEDKQLTVLNAAFSCFGKNGYKKTSMADISVAAGISKASLFQYFGSKDKLYLYLFEYASGKIFSEMPCGSEDFFECLKAGAAAKLRVMARYPGVYHFLSSLVLETDEGIAKKLEQYKQAYTDDAMTGMFKDVNWDKLKPGVSREMLFNAVRWVNEGYLRTAIGHKDAQTMAEELFEYLEIIRKAYYKEEYL